MWFAWLKRLRTPALGDEKEGGKLLERIKDIKVEGCKRKFILKYNYQLITNNHFHCSFSGYII